SLGSPSTRILALHDSPRRELGQVYLNARNYLARMAELHQSHDAEELLTLACRAVGELFDVAHWRISTFDSAGKRFVKLKESPAMSHRVAELEELMGACAEVRQVMFFDIRECDEAAPSGKRPTVNLSRKTSKLALELEASTVCLMPVCGDNGPQAVITLWIRDRDAAAKVLEAELLQSLSVELGARLDGIALTARLRELGSLFDNILESVPQGIVAVGKDGSVMALNAGAESLFSLQRASSLGKPFTQALPQSIGREFKRMIDQLLVKPDTFERQFRLERGRGSTVNLGITASYLLDRQGKPLGWLFLCRDLSLSLEVQKLRELDLLKTEFVNTVSHELKTPLTSILGGLEIVCEDIEPRHRDLLEIVRDSALRLRNLIFDLLNLSKLESVRTQANETACDLKALMEGVARLLPKHPLHNLEIDVPERMPQVLLDNEKIRAALTNYISNAIKYSPKGGRVTVAARVDGEELVLEVSDEGMGISKENLDKLFKKFSRVNASAEIEGTGLGLVIVKRIAELHQGYVFVQSVQGHGSTFGMRLPLKVA
ncbi:partial Sensor histidine kinase WalK, partial [Planctomycetaceae bacterium]